MNEGSPNCHPAESAATTPRWLQRSWGNALESQLPRQKVNRETWLATDSLGAYERNKFNEPRGLHLPIQRMLNTDLWCSDCLLLLLQSSIEPDFPSCLLGAVFWVTRMLTPGLRVLNIPTKWKNSLLLGQMSFFFFQSTLSKKNKALYFLLHFQQGPCGGMCNFHSFVSWQQKFEATDGAVLQLCFI